MTQSACRPVHPIIATNRVAMMGCTGNVTTLPTKGSHMRPPPSRLYAMDRIIATNKGFAFASTPCRLYVVFLCGPYGTVATHRGVRISLHPRTGFTPLTVPSLPTGGFAYASTPVPAGPTHGLNILEA